MRTRSWMAAAACAIAWCWSEPVVIAGEGDPVVNRIALELRIAGLSGQGGEVEIKPGHPACQFTPVVKKVKTGEDQLKIPPFLAKTTSADRDCSFAITIKEPGQPPKLIRRGVRLALPGPDARVVPTQSLTYYLTSPSLATRDTQDRPKR